MKTIPAGSPLRRSGLLRVHRGDLFDAVRSRLRPNEQPRDVRILTIDGSPAVFVEYEETAPAVGPLFEVVSSGLKNAPEDEEVDPGAGITSCEDVSSPNHEPDPVQDDHVWAEVTVREAAVLIGMSPSFVAKWKQRGDRVRVTVREGVRYFNREDVLRMKRPKSHRFDGVCSRAAVWRFARCMAGQRREVFEVSDLSRWMIARFGLDYATEPSLRNRLHGVSRDLRVNDAFDAEGRILGRFEYLSPGRYRVI